MPAEKYIAKCNLLINSFLWKWRPFIPHNKWRLGKHSKTKRIWHSYEM